MQDGIAAGYGTKVDLHLHSYASGTASNWWVRGLGAGTEARECYTPPEEAYRMAKRAGMRFVTLTDHETIDGALTLLHHPDFFVGVEVSALFPEDGAYADVLVYGLDSGAHKEIQARRPNIYDLVDYLREAGLAHVLAHPIYGMPKAVDRKQVEKRLVLFGLWEFVNGSRPAEQNRLAREIATRTDASDLRQLAARHGLPAPPHRRISGTGGSDDHGGVYVGETHTVAPEAGNPQEFLDILRAGEVRPTGKNGSARKLVHTGFRIAGGAIREGNIPKSPLLQDLALTVPLLRNFIPAPSSSGAKLLRRVPLLARLGEPGIRAALVSRYEEQLSVALRGVGSGFPAVDLLSSLGDLIDGHLYIAPYVGVQGYFGRERQKALTLRRELFPEERSGPKIGVFVDGVEGVNGDTATYRSLWAEAEKRYPGRLQLVRCGADNAGGVHSLRAIAELPVPLNEELTLGVPSLLDVMDHVADEEYDSLHVAAPGPLGLAALVAGISLGIPVVGAYHTEFGDYARALSGDTFVAEIVDVAVRQFYERCSAVAVPSQATALALRNRGYGVKDFEVLKDGVDTGLFDPARRDGELREFLGGGRDLLLYAGHIGREERLDLLADGYLKLRRRRSQQGRDDVHLVVVGDGPYRRELESRLGEAATFTGNLEGDTRARTFASCDVFVFPSISGTLGREVAEAQASGLPAVVCGAGGPGELIRPGASGFIAYLGGEGTFLDRIEDLLDPEARGRMGRAAREHAASLSWKSALEKLIGLHARVSSLHLEPARTT